MNTGKAAFFLLFFAVFILFTTCDNFNLPVLDYIENATNSAMGLEYTVTTRHFNNPLGWIAIPPFEPAQITINLRNPQKYDLNLSLSGFEPDSQSDVIMSVELAADNQQAIIFIKNAVRGDIFDLTLHIDANGRPMPDFKLPLINCRYFDNYLLSLGVNDVPLSDFDPDKTNYTVEIDASGGTSFSIMLEMDNDKHSSLRIDGDLYIYNLPSFSWDFSISPNRINETVIIVITADSGETKTYTVTVGGDPQAQIGSTQYLTLEAAINDSPVNSTTVITVLRSFQAQNGYYITDKHIRLITLPNSGEITITSPAGNHALFNIYPDSSLELSPATGSSLILNGGGSSFNDDNRHGVHMSGGTFTMNDRSVITDFYNSATANVGGAGVWAEGTFNMNGGVIKNNSSQNAGGGVRVAASRFYMRGGSIENNYANNSGSGIYVGQNGSFIMSGGFVYGSDDPDKANTRSGGGYNSILLHDTRDPGTEVRYSGSLGNAPIATTSRTLPYASNYIMDLSFGYKTSNANAEIVILDGTTIRAAVPALNLNNMNVTVTHTGSSVAILNNANVLATQNGMTAVFADINMTNATHIRVTASDNTTRAYTLTLQAAAASVL